MASIKSIRAGILANVRTRLTERGYNPVTVAIAMKTLYSCPFSDLEDRADWMLSINPIHLLANYGSEADVRNAHSICHRLDCHSTDEDIDEMVDHALLLINY